MPEGMSYAVFSHPNQFNVGYVKVFGHLHKSKKVLEVDWCVRCCLPLILCLALSCKPFTML